MEALRGPLGGSVQVTLRICSANMVLKRTVSDNMIDFDSITIETLRCSFYVDGVLNSVPTLETAKRLAEQQVELCARGGFDLTKFMSNDHQVLAEIPVEKKATPSLDLDELPVDRALSVK